MVHDWALKSVSCCWVMSSSIKLLTQVDWGKKLFRNWLVNGYTLAYISLTLINSGSLFTVYCFVFLYLWQSVNSATSVACSCIANVEFRHLCAINSPKAIIASNNCVKLYTTVFVFTICHTFSNLLQSCLFGGQHCAGALKNKGL